MSLYRLLDWLVSPLALAAVAPKMGATKVDLQFVSHIQAGMAEQDVFVEHGGQVMRPDANTNGEQPIYSAASAVRDDPFRVGENPLGPFAKGKGLGMSLKQWLAATGGGSYSVEGDRAELKLSLHNLVPNALYTVLTPRVTYPPNFAVEPGLAGTFKSDAKGNGEFRAEIQVLPESTKSVGTAIIVTYNSDGEWRGEFGKNTHQQIFAFLPPPAGI